MGVYSYIRSSGNIITGLSLLGILSYGSRLTAYIRDHKSNLTKTFWELEVTHLILCLIGSALYLFYGGCDGISVNGFSMAKTLVL